MASSKVLDAICFVYFFTHIPITILVDSQAVIPSKYYPEALQQTLQWYGHKFKDPMMLDPPAWFKSFCVCELVVQFPFFFVAVAAFWNGTSQRIRGPLIAYSSHVATTVFAILAHILYNDFSDSKYPGPNTLEEKLKLIGIYSPYLLIPLLMLVRSLFFASDDKKVKQNSSPKKKKKN